MILAILDVKIQYTSPNEWKINIISMNSKEFVQQLNIW